MESSARWQVKPRTIDDIEEGGGGGVLLYCLPLSLLMIDHESHSRRSTLRTPSRDTLNNWALVTSFSFHEGEGVCVIIIVMHVCSPLNRRPSHPYIARTEHVRFLPTRQMFIAPRARRREVFGEPREGWAASRVGGGGTHFMHNRSLNTVDYHILKMPGRSTSGFLRPGIHRAHQARSAVRCPASRMKGKRRSTKNHT